MTHLHSEWNPLDPKAPIPTGVELDDMTSVMGAMPEAPEWLSEYDLAAVADDTEATAEPAPQSEAGTKQRADLDPELARVVEILADADEQQIAEQADYVIGRNGGLEAAEDLHFWEVTRSSIASDAKRTVGELLAQAREHWGKPKGQQDAIDHVMASVMLDRYGSTGPSAYQYSGTDHIGFSVGGALAELAKGDALHDRAAIEKATLCVRLLANLGLYKLCEWSAGSDNQLQTALDLMETYTRDVPGFNPDQAGSEAIRSKLIYALGALEADSRKKRDAEHITGERERRTSQLKLALEKISRTTVLQAYLRSRNNAIARTAADQT